MSVGATYVQAIVGHGLDHPDVVAAVVLLGRERKRGLGIVLASPSTIMCFFFIQEESLAKFFFGYPKD